MSQNLKKRISEETLKLYNMKRRRLQIQAAAGTGKVSAGRW